MPPVPSAASTVAVLDSALLDCVPMPKVIVPAAETAPAAGIDGRLMITPLLSCGNSHTGFCTCWFKATSVATQPEAGQEKYTAGMEPAFPAAVQLAPQSWRNTPMPRTPLAPKVDCESFSVNPVPVHADGAAALTTGPQV